MSELVTRTSQGLLNVETGELLEPTVDNAATVIQACRNMKARLQDVIANATTYLVEESRIQGTKTFKVGKESVVLTGGPSIQYDAKDLMDALREAGCPEERIDEVVVAEISYKINRSVLRQLVAANPNYAAAAESAAREIDLPVRVSVKRS